MLLILTGSDDATADYLVERLNKEGMSFIRLDTNKPTSTLSVGYDAAEMWLTVNNRVVHIQDISNIWFRRPTSLNMVGHYADGERQYVAGEWGAAIEGMLSHVPIVRWMNHPAHNAVASHKVEQLTRAKALGFVIPRTIVTQSPARLLKFWDECDGEVIVKPLLSGYVERTVPTRDTLIYTSHVLESHLASAETLLPKCPTLFQQMIRKHTDVRITVIDEAIYAVSLRGRDSNGLQRLDIRRNNMESVNYEIIELELKLQSAILDLMKSYQLRFAAIDMAIQDDGSWIFFELNPNGQWAWMDIEGVTDIASGFVRSFGRKEA